MSFQPATTSPSVGPVDREQRLTLAIALRRLAYVCLLLLAVSLPFSIKGSVLFFRLAVLFWLALLLVRLFRREKLALRPLPLLPAMLTFLLLTFLSTISSYEPLLSWGRMRTVSLLFVAVLVAQVPQSYRELKALVAVLLFALAVNLGYTAWQYSYGTGVELVQLSPDSSLAKAGLVPDDVIQAIGPTKVRSQQQLLRLLHAGSSADILDVQIARGAPTARWVFRLERQALTSDLSLPGAVARGRPDRAQGFYAHYIPYAEFLMLCGALVFALVLTGTNQPLWERSGFAILLLGVAAALTLTVTRAALGCLLAACLVVLWVRGGRMARLAGIGVIMIALLAGSLWFQRMRGTGWLGQNDSTRYRTLMWADGIRLVKQHPWLGVGMDSIYNHWREWDIRAYRQYPHLKSHFHSSYIQLAVECGLLTLAAWLWLLLGYLALVYRMCKRSPGDSFSDAIALAALAATIAFAGLGVVHYVLGDSEAMMLFWLIVGLSLWISADKEASAISAPSGP